jgi:hypothetical protein
MKIASRFALVAILASAPALAADEELDVTPALNAAAAWLALVDGQRYGETWDKSSELFQKATQKLQWEVSLQTIRGPLGPAAYRKLRSAAYTRALPGAPPGEYVVIQYDTNFETRPLTTETITTSKDKDGAWRVSGYFIR